MAPTPGHPSTPRTMPASTLARTRRDLIEATGKLCQWLGLPRSTGQIFGLLFLSRHPMSLDDIARQLSISKASASTGTRQLQAWKAIRQVWVRGDRRGHYEAEGDLREVVRAGYESMLKPKLTDSRGRLGRLLATLEEERQSGELDAEDYAFCRERLDKVTRLQRKALGALPLAERML